MSPAESFVLVFVVLSAIGLGYLLCLLVTFRQLRRGHLRERQAFIDETVQSIGQLADPFGRYPRLGSIEVRDWTAALDDLQAAIDASRSRLAGRDRSLGTSEVRLDSGDGAASRPASRLQLGDRQVYDINERRR